MSAHGGTGDPPSGREGGHPAEIASADGSGPEAPVLPENGQHLLSWPASAATPALQGDGTVVASSNPIAGADVFSGPDAGRDAARITTAAASRLAEARSRAGREWPGAGRNGSARAEGREGAAPSGAASSSDQGLAEVRVKIAELQDQHPGDAAKYLAALPASLKWRCFLGVSPAQRAAIMLEMSVDERRLALSMLRPGERTIAERFLGITPVGTTTPSKSAAGPHVDRPPDMLTPSKSAAGHVDSLAHNLGHARLIDSVHTTEQLVSAPIIAADFVRKAVSTAGGEASPAASLQYGRAAGGLSLEERLFGETAAPALYATNASMHAAVAAAAAVNGKAADLYETAGTVVSLAEGATSNSDHADGQVVGATSPGQNAPSHSPPNPPLQMQDAIRQVEGLEAHVQGFQDSAGERRKAGEAEFQTLNDDEAMKLDMNLKVMEQKVNATVNGLPEGKLHDAAGSPALPMSNGESRSDGGDEEAAKGKRLSTMQKTALTSLPPPRPIPPTTASKTTTSLSGWEHVMNTADHRAQATRRARDTSPSPHRAASSRLIAGRDAAPATMARRVSFDNDHRVHRGLSTERERERAAASPSSPSNKKGDSKDETPGTEMHTTEERALEGHLPTFPPPTSKLRSPGFNLSEFTQPNSNGLTVKQKSDRWQRYNSPPPSRSLPRVPSVSGLRSATASPVINPHQTQLWVGPALHSNTPARVSVEMQRSSLSFNANDSPPQHRPTPPPPHNQSQRVEPALQWNTPAHSSLEMQHASMSFSANDSPPPQRPTPSLPLKDIEMLDHSSQSHAPITSQTPPAAPVPISPVTAVNPKGMHTVDPVAVKAAMDAQISAARLGAQSSAAAGTDSPASGKRKEPSSLSRFLQAIGLRRPPSDVHSLNTKQVLKQPEMWNTNLLPDFPDPSRQSLGATSFAQGASQRIEEKMGTAATVAQVLMPLDELDAELCDMALGCLGKSSLSFDDIPIKSAGVWLAVTENGLQHIRTASVEALPPPKAVHAVCAKIAQADKDVARRVCALLLTANESLSPVSHGKHDLPPSRPPPSLASLLPLTGMGGGLAADRLLVSISPQKTSAPARELEFGQAAAKPPLMPPRSPPRSPEKCDDDRDAQHMPREPVQADSRDEDTEEKEGVVLDSDTARQIIERLKKIETLSPWANNSPLPLSRQLESALERRRLGSAASEGLSTGGLVEVGGEYQPTAHAFAPFEARAWERQIAVSEGIGSAEASGASKGRAEATADGGAAGSSELVSPPSFGVKGTEAGSDGPLVSVGASPPRREEGAAVRAPRQAMSPRPLLGESAMVLSEEDMRRNREGIRRLLASPTWQSGYPRTPTSAAKPSAAAALGSSGAVRLWGPNFC